MSKSYVVNSFVVYRKEDAANCLFNSQCEGVRLNGYAIIPLERLSKLIELANLSGANIEPVHVDTDRIALFDREIKEEEKQ